MTTVTLLSCVGIETITDRVDGRESWSRQELGTKSLEKEKERKTERRNLYKASHVGPSGIG